MIQLIYIVGNGYKGLFTQGYLFTDTSICKQMQFLLPRGYVGIFCWCIKWNSIELDIATSKAAYLPPRDQLSPCICFHLKEAWKYPLSVSKYRFHFSCPLWWGGLHKNSWIKLLLPKWMHTHIYILQRVIHMPPLENQWRCVEWRVTPNVPFYVYVLMIIN